MAVDRRQWRLYNAPAPGLIGRPIRLFQAAKGGSFAGPAPR